MAQLPDEPSVTLRLTHPPRPRRGQLHEVLQAHPGFRSDERIGEALRQSFHDTNDKFIANDPESADPEHGVLVFWSHAGSGHETLPVLRKLAGITRR